MIDNVEKEAIYNNTALAPPVCKRTLLHGVHVHELHRGTPRRSSVRMDLVQQSHLPQCTPSKPCLCTEHTATLYTLIK